MNKMIHPYPAVLDRPSRFEVLKIDSYSQPEGLRSYNSLPSLPFVSERLLALIHVIVFLCLAVHVFAQGIHWDEADLSIWQDRAINGPYKSNGDAYASVIPAEWQRIENNANQFRSNPTADRKSDYTIYTDRNQAKTVTNHLTMVDAAFYALVTNDSSLATTVKNELVWHSTQSGLQISPSTIQITDKGNWFRAEWLSRLLICADFVEDAFSPSELSTFKAWIADWAYSYEASIHKELSENLFRNRYQRDYNSNLGYNATNPYFDGKYAYQDSSGVKHNPIAVVHKHYNNRRAIVVEFFALTGVWLNDSILKDRGKLYVEEWIQFGVFPDGSQGEYERNSTSSNIQQGLAYSQVNMGIAAIIASAFDKNGDPSLFTYSTPNGIFGTECASGEPHKTLKLTVDTYFDLIEKQKLWYYYNGPIANEYLIDNTAEIGYDAGKQWIGEIYFAPIANRHWKDERILKGYLRTNPGSPNYPSSASGICSAGHYGPPWRGWNGATPSLLFMFAEMEGITTSYPSPSTTPDGYRETQLADGRTVFGFDPAWSAGREFEAAFDGDVNTFYDYGNSNSIYLGIDFEQTVNAEAIRFHPRLGEEVRMLGGLIQASNESSTSGYVTLHEITTTPEAREYVIPIDSNNAYRYYRYVSPANSYGNIAEFDVDLSTTAPLTDGDDLPDEWEILYFGGTNVTNGGEEEDFDGDGTTNYDEYVAGTDPTDPNDTLKLLSVTGVSWNSILGRIYVIHFTDDNWRTTQKTEPFPGSGETMYWFASGSYNINKRQYQIEVIMD